MKNVLLGVAATALILGAATQSQPIYMLGMGILLIPAFNKKF